MRKTLHPELRAGASARADPVANPDGESHAGFYIDDSQQAFDPDMPAPKFGPRWKRPSSREEARVIQLFCAILFGLCIFVVFVLVYTNRGLGQRDSGVAAPTGLDDDRGFNMKQNWGSYSPYFNSGVRFEGISKTAPAGEYTLPRNCTYKQVHVLHRHAERFPAGSTVLRMREVARKLKSMTRPPAGGQLAWIETWEYTLGKEQLVGAGVGSMFDSGARFWGTHGRLLYGAPDAIRWNRTLNKFANGTARPRPLLRATDQERIRDSALAWAAGFFNLYNRAPAPVQAVEVDRENSEPEYSLLLQPETVGSNSSLAGYFGCPATETEAYKTIADRTAEWDKIYLANAAVRLQKLLPGYDNLTAREVVGFQDLCAFETAAYGQSAFCRLFTQQEWRGYEYHSDLKFYYESGWGSHKIGPASGLPWLQELHARLAGQLITEAANGVNVTLDSSPETFPLDQPFYLDVTHDSIIISVLSALQFDWIKQELPTSRILVPRSFIVSRLTPFAARLYVEVLGCGDGDFVRLKLNERLLPLGDLEYCPERDDGLCPFGDFLKSVKHCLEKISFDKVCYG